MNFGDLRVEDLLDPGFLGEFHLVISATESRAREDESKPYDTAGAYVTVTYLPVGADQRQVHSDVSEPGPLQICWAADWQIQCYRVYRDGQLIWDPKDRIDKDPATGRELGWKNPISRRVSKTSDLTFWDAVVPWRSVVIRPTDHTPPEELQFDHVSFNRLIPVDSSWSQFFRAKGISAQQAAAEQRLFAKAIFWWYHRLHLDGKSLRQVFGFIIHCSWVTTVAAVIFLGSILGPSPVTLAIFLALPVLCCLFLLAVARWA